MTHGRFGTRAGGAHRTTTRSGGVAVCLALGLALGGSALPVSASAGLTSDTQFYVRHPDKGAIQQIADLQSGGDKADANRLRWMISTPQAIWLTGGSAKQVRQQVRATVEDAAGTGTVPVLVAYDLPFRDCSQYSAGGAASVSAYEDWIDAFADGIGDRRALVILEPDGLGIIPWYRPFDGGGYEWCQPAGADPATAATDRFAMLNHAVDALKAHAGVSVYLDATHSSWLAVGDAADRLMKAGISRADGFFLDVSNFQWTANSVAYGTWISDCIAFVTELDGSAGACPNQYWNGGPATGWIGTAMDGSQAWRNETYSGNPADLAWNTVGIDSRWATMLGSTDPTVHFVIDTSRNGVGPWVPPSHPAGDAQDWCNPPDRGLGERPSANTGQPLVDAYLWVKTPGESDGQCYRWTSGPLDPVRNVEDPAAGQWFPDAALELATNANPPLPDTKATPGW